MTIVGPTASGKTTWGLSLAREQNAEIISADSRQVYRDLLVGTAKPGGTWKKNSDGSSAYFVQDIPYHLVDFLPPDQAFSAAQFIEETEKLIKEIEARGRRAILVGGTGFYLSALEKGLAALPPSNAELRAALREIADTKGRPHLHAELARVDPAAAEKIPANNIHRVIRALEVYKLTGKRLSEWHDDHQKKKKNPARTMEYVGIEIDRETLHRRIEARCHAMVEGGMIAETENVLKKGFSPASPALSGLGYPRVRSYLNNELTREKMTALLMQDTRRYAKRQMTWFRHQMKVTWKKL
jgi:tRNA dimethylallyltransferase